MSFMRMILLFFVLLGFILIIQSSLLIWRINKGVKIAQSSMPFERKDPNASVSVLIVGDSTGVGTGVKSPLDSIAGRLHHDFPDAEIINRAENGAHVDDVISQLTYSDKRYDLILIQAGGNDILRFTDLEALQNAIETVLDTAVKKADMVIFLSTGNVGLAPAFFAPLSWIYTARTRRVRELFINAAEQESIEYVDLFQERDADPFLKDPQRYYASDYLHPGSDGYRLWYEEIVDQTSVVDFLQAKRVHRKQ